MEVKIKTGLVDKYSHTEYRDIIRKIEGTIVPVDTEYMYKDQINTFPIPEVSENGIRILFDDIEEVFNDERYGMSRCNYCGLSTETGQLCRQCDTIKYMKEFFPGTKRELSVEASIKSALHRAFT